MNWNFLHSIEQIDSLSDLSHDKPVLIFKHSTRCSISNIAKQRLDSDWNQLKDKMDLFFLDLIAHREVSDYIAKTFAVSHESPQVILLKDGRCTFDSSHLDIHSQEIQEALTHKVI